MKPMPPSPTTIDDGLLTSGGLTFVSGAAVSFHTPNPMKITNNNNAESTRLKRQLAKTHTPLNVSLSCAKNGSYTYVKSHIVLDVLYP